MSLATLQRAFQAHILTGDDAVATLVEPSMRRGLPVYHYAYRAALRDVLRDTFEKTLLWLGEDSFDAAANAYVEATPSKSWTLSDYGSGFPDMLASRFDADPEVGEIAWLDWSLRQAFAARSIEAPDTERLAAVDWETVHLALAPHVAFRRIETNVIDVWNGLPDTPVAADKLDAPIGLVVWRKDLTPEFRSADLLEVDALERIAAGRSFAEMCAEMAEQWPIEPALIGSLLGRWLGDSIVAIAE